MGVTRRIIAASMVVAVLCACGDRPTPPTVPASAPAANGPARPAATTPAQSPPPSAPAPAPVSESMGIGVGTVTDQWTGDFDGMVARRRIRILAPYSRTLYFVDSGVPRGIAQDIAVMLEESLNRQLMRDFPDWARLISPIDTTADRRSAEPQATMFTCLCGSPQVCEPGRRDSSRR